MPHFFFNHISGKTACIDEIGTEFVSLEAAYLETCQAALAIAFEKLRARQDPTDDAFEILDNERKLLIHVPFLEVLKPGAPMSVSPLKRESALVFENCQREVERNIRLKNEIRAEFAQARKLFLSIRANLSARIQTDLSALEP